MSVTCLIEQSVGCLLYADDLVLLPAGLQRSLDKLNSYCNTWKLQVNIQKTKIMILSRTRNEQTQSFRLAKQELEQVETYTYLGFKLSRTGTFKLAEKAMADKAARAMFKLRKLVQTCGLTPKVSIKLFDQLIKPICLYGSELWGPDFITMREVNPDKFFNAMEKLNCEKVNLSFSKSILGVHRKAQNSAVRGELARTVLGIDVAANILKYKQH